jgi:hypothetical protein
MNSCILTTVPGRVEVVVVVVVDVVVVAFVVVEVVVREVVVVRAVVVVEDEVVVVSSVTHPLNKRSIANVRHIILRMIKVSHRGKKSHVYWTITVPCSYRLWMLQ